MEHMCPCCGEPWDNDSLHEEAIASERTYAAVASEFRKIGCKTMKSYGSHPNCVPVINDQTVIARAAYDLLGDDMDGAAAMLEDWA